MIQHLLTFFGADPCPGGNFLIFPKWYKYLPAAPNSHPCTPALNNLNDVWLIVAAVIEILLRIAAIMAVIFVIYAGFSYTTSQGDPEGTSRAKGTLVNALVGLAIAVSAAAIVSFIAKSVS